MDMIFGACPECDTKLRCPESATLIRCPNCEHEFQTVLPYNPKTQLYLAGKRCFVIGLIIFLSYFGLAPMIAFGTSNGLVILFLIPIALGGSIISMVGLSLMSYDKFSNGNRSIVGELVGIGTCVVIFFWFYQTLTGFNGIV